jgi:LysM repeat protein
MSPATTTASSATSSGAEGGGEVADARQYPSLGEVGRADFTYTVVAGDFLASIADRYGVEIDDIVGANEWDDGREHLLLPGDEIYLPADAVAPSAATVMDGEPIAASVYLPDMPCGASPGFFGSHQVRPGESLDSVAATFGVSTDEVTDGRGYYGAEIADFAPGLSVYSPCRDKWPPNVQFFLGPDVCPSDGSMMAEYSVQPGDTPESVAEQLGVPLDLLKSNRPDEDAFMNSFEQGTIELCTSWFEG